MTSEERVKLALQHQEPDRIPLDLGATLITGIHIEAYRSLLNYLGIQKAECPILFERPQNARIHDDVLTRFNVDVRGLVPHEPEKLRGEDDHYDYYVDEWGVKWRRPKQDGKYFDVIRHPLEGDVTREDLEVYTWPNLADRSRIEGLKTRAQELKKNTGCAIILEGILGGEVFDGSFFLRGYENFYLDLAGNPSFAGYLLDKMVDLQLQYWEMALQELQDDVLIVRLGDDLGEQTKTRISPRMYRKLIKPRHQRLISSIKKMAKGDLYIFLHTDGAVSKLIPDFIEIGVDILNPVQYTATDMNTRRLKKEFGSELTFWGGGIDTQSVLPNGTPGEVQDEVKRRIDDLAPGGGFVFCQVHNIQYDVPPQNIMAVYETLQKYGGY